MDHIILRSKSPLEMYDHILRLWPSFMADKPMTLIEWQADYKQVEFYRWICQQAGEYADLY